MTEFLINKFVKNKEDIKNPQVIKEYGYLSGGIGIVSNTILSIIKIIIGLSINSIAVIADAVNNISDIGASIVAIVGFNIADRPADEEHPFGHARAEYLSALVIAVMVMVVGFKFLSTSFEKIRFPEAIEFSYITFFILLLSIIIKIWQSKVYTNIGDRIKSKSLRAAALDSKSDVITTSVVAFSLISSQFIDFPIDGYIGFVVSIFIIYNGFNIVKEAIDPLLGEAADPELVEEIENMVTSFPEIQGAHDLMIHSYGKGRIIATIHAEVSDKLNIVKAHETIDTAERVISKELGINLIIHMDPINYDDENVQRIYKLIRTYIENKDSRLSIHDFRIIEDRKGEILFDLLVSEDYKGEKVTILLEDIKKMLWEKEQREHIYITVDRKNVNF